MARPRNINPAGSVIGAVLGAVLGGPAGAAVGGLIGTAANDSTAVPLQEALKAALAQRGYGLVSLTRDNLFAGSIVFRSANDRFWSAHAVVNAPPAVTQEKIEDDLFDELLRQVDGWRPQ